MDGMHGELQIALVAQVVAAGGHNTGEVVVEALFPGRYFAKP